MQETLETQVRCLGWEDPLEERMTMLSSVLAWRIPWTGEPGRLHAVHRISELDMTEMTEYACTHWFIIKGTIQELTQGLLFLSCRLGNGAKSSNPLVMPWSFFATSPHPEATWGPSVSSHLTSIQETLYSSRESKGFRSCMWNHIQRQNIYLLYHSNTISLYRGCGRLYFPKVAISMYHTSQALLII